MILTNVDAIIILNVSGHSLTETLDLMIGEEDLTEIFLMINEEGDLTGIFLMRNSGEDNPVIITGKLFKSKLGGLFLFSNIY